MSVRRIIQTFETWRAGGDPMVLATVCDTLGSTYSKPGHRILIAANGNFQGLVSGGCLEGDLAERAQAVLAGRAAELVTYDLRDEADEIWGLGIGCNGLIRVLLQPLDAQNGYEPFASIAAVQMAHEPAVVATVVQSERSDAAAGATLLWTQLRTRQWGLGGTLAVRLADRCRDLSGDLHARIEDADAGTRVLYAPIKPIPQLLVLGAGLDAVPLVELAAGIGWRVTVADHRPGYLQQGEFARAERAVLVDPRQLGTQLPLAEFDAVVVMSHHLQTDRTYLEQLAGSVPRYLGVLGPAKRRARLLEEIGAAARPLEGVLRGPVGLDIGADSPESIALSLLAEVHATLAGSSGSALTGSR
jgi:xanthine dehydrogenase accessory factor